MRPSLLMTSAESETPDVRVRSFHRLRHTTTMKKLVIILFASLLGIGITAWPHARRQDAPRAFRLPDVPDALTAPEQRAAYLAMHYWDHFDFADTALIAMPEITEQAFVDFLSILPYTGKAPAAVDTLFRRAGAEKEMLYHFISLSDKYLYEPNSPMHDEELYILVLRALVEHPRLEQIDKLRPRRLLELALKNRPGDLAADFAFVGRDGRKRRLSGMQAEYLVLYFYDPECGDCRRVKERMSASGVINGLMDTERLTVLSVCVEGKTRSWEREAPPSRWTDGYDEDRRLTRGAVYDLKAMPTLYLLDREKRVLLKDASVERIETWLDKR